MKNKLATIGLVGLISAMGATCTQDSATPGIYTGNKYVNSAIVEASGADGTKWTTMVYDLDGDKVADEVFECECEVYGPRTDYKVFTDMNIGPITDISKWQHYVVPGISKPLVSNNMTNMTQAQRDHYTIMLNQQE